MKCRGVGRDVETNSDIEANEWRLRLSGSHVLPQDCRARVKEVGFREAQGSSHHQDPWAKVGGGYGRVGVEEGEEIPRTLSPHLPISIGQSPSETRGQGDKFTRASQSPRYRGKPRGLETRGSANREPSLQRSNVITPVNDPAHSR